MFSHRHRVYFEGFEVDEHTSVACHSLPEHHPKQMDSVPGQNAVDEPILIVLRQRLQLRGEYPRPGLPVSPLRRISKTLETPSPTGMTEIARPRKRKEPKDYRGLFGHNFLFFLRNSATSEALYHTLPLILSSLFFLNLYLA